MIYHSFKNDQYDVILLHALKKSVATSVIFENSNGLHLRLTLYTSILCVLPVNFFWRVEELFVN